MGNKKLKKAILITLALLLMLICIVPAGLASGNKKMLEAWYMNIRIMNNNREIYPEAGKEPFIVDGTTYAPVRMLAEILNKEVLWDGDNYIVYVNDKLGQSLDYLNMQLIMKDNEIKYLEDRIKSLEKQSSSLSDIDELEKELNYYYGEYKDIDFDIGLSGSKSRVTVVIEFSLKRDKSAWNKLTTKNITSYLQDICDEILDIFPKADISGYFKDSSKTTSSKMEKFTVTSRGNVSLDDEDSRDYVDLRDFEYELEDMFYDYFRDFDVDIELDGDEDDITFTVYMDYDKYEREWDKIKDKDLEYFMEDIYWEIDYEFKGADITGYIYDWRGTVKLAQLTVSGKSTKFKRYK